jgi:hypothetical protein
LKIVPDVAVPLCGYCLTETRASFRRSEIAQSHGFAAAAVVQSAMFRLESSMKYISHWKIPPSSIDAAIKKFLETGGAPPEGVKLLGRWHGMNGQGFAISESNDAKAMYQWYAQWANVMEISVSPCVEDAEAGPILASMAQR